MSAGLLGQEEWYLETSYGGIFAREGGAMAQTFLFCFVISLCTFAQKQNLSPPPIFLSCYWVPEPYTHETIYACSYF